MNKKEKERLEHGLVVLGTYAGAIRGDWGSIDGRSVRIDLWTIMAYLSGERETLTFKDVNVCKNGHWFDHCESAECWDECDRRDSDGAPCGYPVHPWSGICEKGHE